VGTIEATHTYGKKHRGAPWPCGCMVGRFGIPQAFNTASGCTARVVYSDTYGLTRSLWIT